MENRICDKIVDLRLSTRRACMCETTKGRKNTLTLKSKLLYILLSGKKTPPQLMEQMLIGKTNLALLAKSMISDRLIVRSVVKSDRRSISYEITEDGENYINSRLELIEKNFKTILTKPEDYNAAIENINKVLELLSFL